MEQQTNTPKSGNSTVDTTEIQKFLEGKDDTKYIVGIEAGYSDNFVYLTFDDPIKGKYVEKHTYNPFTFCIDLKAKGKELYPTQTLRDAAMKKHGITVSKLKTGGDIRLENGQKYLVKSSKKVGNLVTFFKEAGLEIYGDRTGTFTTYQPSEQFLIQTGKRLFKGFEKYSDLHKFYFDIETTGLDPLTSRIFLLGMKDNRGFQKVLEVDENNYDETEKQLIIDFFLTIQKLRPTIIAGYNSDAFDFDFIVKRAAILGLNLGTRDEEYNWSWDVPTSLNPNMPIKRKESFIKLGGEQEKYFQTIMWGYNVIDISHAVRRAQAINSDIKSWGLKYICKYAKVNKPNRMYVEGDKIYKIWKENNNYYINPTDSQYVLNSGQIKPDGWNDITGKQIIEQYLIDDLCETEQVDEVFNQQAFSMGAILPTNFSRASTMGNAVAWKILMVAYSYENNLAIPKHEKKRDFVGGLSRLYKMGFSKDILKMDFSSLYPSIQLTYDVFPKCDINGALKQMLTYFRDGRNRFKKLGKEAEAKGNEELAKIYDTKQLPMKILNNSCFGALSAPEVFPWADIEMGERITCTGRQYLRKMVDFFISYDFVPIILDTDGINLIIPNDIEKITYKGLTGYLAVLEMFNEQMSGVMKLEEDGIWLASINMARKNYANLGFKKDKKTGEKHEYIKLVGNTIKSKKLPTYIEKFFDEALKLLLSGDGKGFVEYYYEYLAKIYNKQIPLIQIANKGRVKLTIEQYKKKSNQLNKNGKPLPKQAHMELLLASGANPSLGEVVYYVNNGNKKSVGDVKCSYLIYEKEFETNPNMLGDYNVARAIATFNTRIFPLLICFGHDVRDTLIVNNPQNRQYYTSSQLELVNGLPFTESQAPKMLNREQDILNVSEYKVSIHNNEPLFEMSINEIKFWNRSGLDPNEIFDKFTTELSPIKLEIEKIKEVVDKIKLKFRENDLEVKWISEKYNDGDIVLTKEDEKWTLNEVKGGILEKIQEIDMSLMLSK